MTVVFAFIKHVCIRVFNVLGVVILASCPACDQPLHHVPVDITLDHAVANAWSRSAIFQGKGVIRVNAGHELLLAVEVGELVNQTKPVVNDGFGGIAPGVVQLRHQFFFQ